MQYTALFFTILVLIDPLLCTIRPRRPCLYLFSCCKFQAKVTICCWNATFLVFWGCFIKFSSYCSRWQSRDVQIASCINSLLFKRGVPKFNKRESFSSIWIATTVSPSSSTFFNSFNCAQGEWSRQPVGLKRWLEVQVRWIDEIMKFLARLRYIM